MREGFVSLESSLRQPSAVVNGRAESKEPRQHAAVQAIQCPAASAAGELSNELTFARLAALEAFERAVPRLLEALARDVLARELSVAGPDLQALAAAILEEFAAEQPVALAVAPCDAGSVSAGLAVRADPRLRAGDLVVEVRDGEIDARFAIRLAAAISSSAEGE